MGKALADAFAPAREVFQEVDDALSQKLSRLMWEGPESDLTLTENAQPAIMAASIAIIRVLQKEARLDLAPPCAPRRPAIRWANIPRSAAAGAFTLADTARLLKTRGQAMQSRRAGGRGRDDRPDRRRHRRRRSRGQGSGGAGGVCVVANDNAPARW